MNNTMLIELTDQKAISFLNELEKLHWIKVLEENVGIIKPKLSDKYKGIISKEDGQKLNEHLDQMRGEWNTI